MTDHQPDPRTPDQEHDMSNIEHRYDPSDPTLARAAEAVEALVGTEVDLGDEEHACDRDCTLEDPWQAVDDALMPYLTCDRNNHHPRSCPAVVAVMHALGLDR